MQSGSATRVVSYNVPSVSDTNADNMPTTGSCAVSVVGTGFGMFHFSGHTRVGSTACESSGWLADSTTVCRVPSVVGSQLTIIVTAHALSGSVTAAVSADTPCVSSASPSNVVGTGRGMITLVGTGMGSQRMSLSLIHI